MRSPLLACLAAFAILAGCSTTVQPLSTSCEILPEFQALHDADPKVVGECVGGVGAAYGDLTQRTTNGIMVQRQSDGFVLFTDGYTVWNFTRLHKPTGLQSWPGDAASAYSTWNGTGRASASDPAPHAAIPVPHVISAQPGWEPYQDPLSDRLTLGEAWSHAGLGGGRIALDYAGPAYLPLDIAADALQRSDPNLRHATRTKVSLNGHDAWQWDLGENSFTRDILWQESDQQWRAILLCFKQGTSIYRRQFMDMLATFRAGDAG